MNRFCLLKAHTTHIFYLEQIPKFSQFLSAEATKYTHFESRLRNETRHVRSAFAGDLRADFFIFFHFLIRRLIKMCNVHDSNDISHSLPDVHKTSQRGKVRREDAQKCFRKLENWKRCRRRREMAKQKQKR